ncbi:MAG: hypothetical protein IJ501_05010 [Bacilli bacterium]|nr:hypothetical protein [Bacilli bacterium]
MLKDDFVNIYINDTIRTIKRYIKGNVNLESERVEEIDKKMVVVLKEVINTELKELDVDSYGTLIYKLLPMNDKKESRRIWCNLVLYYTALYYDNVALLQRMLKEEINFGSYPHGLSIYTLDNSITSKFTEVEYIEMVKNSKSVLEHFYRSTKNLDLEEREKYIDRFSKLFKLRKDDLKEKNYSSCINISLVLKKEQMDIFTDETYLRASREQLSEVIGSMGLIPKNKDTKERLNNLIQTTDFCQHYWNADLMFDLFNDEELFDKGWFASKYFEHVIDNKLDFNRALSLYNLNSEKIERSFWNSGNVKWLNSNILNSFDDEAIIQLIDLINFNEVDFVKDLSKLKRIVKKEKHKSLVRNLFRK